MFFKLKNDEKKKCNYPERSCDDHMDGKGIFTKKILLISCLSIEGLNL